MSETAIIDVETAAESARTGDMDAAVDMAAQVLHATDRRGGAMYRGAAGTVLVTSLLARNAEGDRTRAQTAVERLASARRTTAPSCMSSLCSGCGHCWRLRAAITTHTAGSWIGIGRGPMRAVSKATSRSPVR